MKGVPLKGPNCVWYKVCDTHLTQRYWGRDGTVWLRGVEALQHRRILLACRSLHRVRLALQGRGRGRGEGEGEGEGDLIKSVVKATKMATRTALMLTKMIVHIYLMHSKTNASCTP